MKNKTTEQHTPTPWYISGDENGITTIRGDKANGRLFAVADVLKSEDAELIVRAVNSHAELVSALKFAQEALNGKHADLGIAYLAVTDALKRAEGKEEVV